MHAGVDVHFVLRQLALLRGRLKLKVALMIDWSQSVRGTAMPTLIKEARAAGVNAVLLHGLPPRQRVAWNQCCRDYGIARVLTIYPESDLDGQDWTNLAFVYLVTRYGRAGTGAAATPANRVQLADAVRRVRSHTAMPIFFGFGIDTADAVRQAGDCGADGVVVGSHFVDWLHRHVQSGRVDTAALTAYAEQFRVPVDECRPAPFDLGVR
jgi:tryptophan synthase alpha chain